MKREVLDKLDLKILEELKENSKITISQLSRKLNVPITTIHSRIKKLQENKIIEKYTIKINYKKLGYDILAYIFVKYDPNSNISQKELAKQILKLENVEEVSIVTEEYDLILKTKSKNIDDFSKFLLEKLRGLPGVKETVSFVVLEHYE